MRRAGIGAIAPGAIAGKRKPEHAPARRAFERRDRHEPGFRFWEAGLGGYLRLLVHLISPLRADPTPRTARIPPGAIGAYVSALKKIATANSGTLPAQPVTIA